MDEVNQFLLNCLRCALEPGERQPPTLPASFDETAVFRAAQRQRAVGALWRLDQRYPGYWPESLRERMRANRYSFWVYAGEAVTSVQAALAELAREGIPAVVMKGWEYIFTVYGGDFSLRPCDDIDILIPPDRVREAEEVLARHGFAPTAEFWPGFRFRHDNAAFHYQARDDQHDRITFGVDMHWAMFNLRTQDRWIRLEDVFQRAESLMVGDAPARRLCVEDHILHGCGHLDIHHGGAPELFRFYELTWVIRNAQPAVDWPTLFQRAAEWRLRIPLHSVLEEMERLFPGTLPVEAAAGLAALLPGQEERKAYARMMKFRETPFVYLLPPRWTPAGLLDAVWFLFEAFVPGPRFMEYRYGKSRFWPLLYLRRALNAVGQMILIRRKG